MTNRELASILRNQIQDSLQEKGQKRYELENVEKNLESLLLSMEEVDDRQIKGIDISGKKEGLESFLKINFDITDDDLVTANEKLRFALELKRAEITIELKNIDDRIASCNRRMMIADPSFEIFGNEDYDPRSVEAYNKILKLEKDLRNLIVNILENIDRKNWWKNSIPERIQEDVGKLYNEELARSNLQSGRLREIDFADFSHYEQIFKEKPNAFFSGDEQKWAIVSKLADMRKLRNAVMHGRTLSDEEFTKLQTCHTDIMKFVKELERKNG